MTEEITNNNRGNNQIQKMIDITTIEIGIIETTGIVIGIIIIRTTTIITEITIATTINQTGIIVEVAIIETRIAIIKRTEIQDQNTAIIISQARICVAMQCIYDSAIYIISLSLFRFALHTVCELWNLSQFKSLKELLYLL